MAVATSLGIFSVPTALFRPTRPRPLSSGNLLMAAFKFVT